MIYVLPLSCIAAMTVSPAFGGTLLIATIVIHHLEKWREEHRKQTSPQN